ncbi:hypothetical protein [Streptomyces sp. NBC_01353]|uniref:hypothetical protein n=1 Tax=Streptomyces sp. NBC_01353 TaxID=2903835 RepID=UPI002E3125CA|nr:hypothetical protein [Streptomyces sp. NBC_01353]
MSRPVQGGLSVAALVIIPLLAVGGSDSFRAALDFTSGVLSLVSLTASVAWGLIATDRLLLSPRHRLLAQGIHRATAVASLGFLLLHATVKVSLGHVEPIGALIPFGLGVTGTSALIGFGSLAGLLMVVAASTGALRSTLAGRSRFAARWRPLHMLAYPAWCFALVHGLYTGRPAATWVVVMYCLALTFVAVAVSLRMLPAPTQRELADRFVGLLASLEGRTRPEEANRAADPVEGPTGAENEGERGGYEPPTVSAEWLDRPGRPSLPPSPEPLAPPVPSSRLYDSPPPLYESTSPLYESPPPLYETAPPIPTSAPTVGPGTSARFSAAYRAVSRAAPAPDPTPYTSGDAPLAERIPMTEELPVVPDPSLRPGFWPTPSPPMPTYSSPPPAGEPWTAPAGDRP